MPVNMALATLLMSGAIQAGQPVTKLGLGGDVISQPHGGAPMVMQAAMHGKQKGGKKSWGKLSPAARKNLLVKRSKKPPKQIAK
jgi:hypothetical protein